MQKKILHIAYSGFGGQPNVAKNIANYGNNCDEEFRNEILFCGIENLHNSNKDFCIKNNIPYYFILKKRGMDFLFFINLYFELKKIKPFAIIAHSNSYHFILLFYRFLNSTKIISVEHHSISLRNIKTHIHTFLSGLVSQNIVVLTKEAQQYFLAKNLISIKKIKIIPNGIFQQNIQNINKQLLQNQLNIGIACRLVEGKDLYTVFKVCKLLIADNINFKLIIAGDGVLKNEFEKFVEKNNLQNYISFLGNLNSTQMQDFYSQINLFLLSSQGEGMPVSILESFMNSIPCIGSDVSGVNSIISDKKNGLLFELGNEKDLYDKILFMRNNSDITEAIIEQGKIDFKENYSIQICYQKYKNLIKNNHETPS